MRWFPKKMQEGDMRAASEKRLLQGGMEPVEVLVRELAQNAWDARGRPGQTVEFELCVRSLPASVRRGMVRVLAGPPRESLKLDEWLRHGDGEVLEVSDRGTTGLRGPTRTDTPVPRGEPTNFIDFVYSVGATKPAGGDTGGTYGFGKSAAYAFSEVGTIIIWSRVRLADGSFEERLIASAIGDPFDHRDLRHTGRHWWGDIVEDGQGERVEPLVGAAAESLARAWFTKHFAEHETGTSLLILAPLGGAGASTGRSEQLDESLLSAALVNLWPKVIPPRGADHAPMSIVVQGTAGRVVLRDRIEGPTMHALRSCLEAVREPEAQPSDGVVLRALVHGGRKRVVGHVAFTRILGTGPRTEADERMVDRVACMRRKAELIVCYDKHRPSESEIAPWVGVMQPTAERDADFAAAEPAAHNQWYPKQLSDPEAKTYVNVALTRIGDEVTDFLGLRKDPSRSLLDTAAARLGEGLAGMFTGLAGGAVTRTGMGRPGKERGRGAGAPRPVLGAPLQNPIGDEVQIAVPVHLHGETAVDSTVSAAVTVAVDGGEGVEDERARIVGWSTGEGVLLGPDLPVAAGGPRPIGHLMIQTSSSVVPQVTVVVRAGDAA